MRNISYLILSIFFILSSAYNAAAFGTNMMTGRIEIEINGSNEKNYTFCQNDTVTFIITLIDLDEGLGSYELYGTYAGMIQFNNYGQFVITQDGYLVIEYTTLDGNITVQSDTIFFTIETPELYTVNPDTTICKRAPYPLSGSADLDGSVAWSPALYLDDSTKINAIARVAENMTYTLVYTSPFGACIVRDTVEVNIKPLDPYFLSDTIMICNTEIPYTLRLHQRANAPDRIHWSGPGFTINNTLIDNVLIEESTSGRYSVLVEGEDCLIPETVWVQIDSLPELPMSIFPVKDIYCPGDSIALLSTKPDENLYPDIRYTWPGYGSHFISPDYTLNATLVTTDTITYYRRVINNSCTRIDSISIDVPQPKIELSWKTAYVCFGESKQIEILNSSQLTDINWIPEEKFSCSDCFNPEVLEEGSYTVTGVYNGCPAEETFRLFYYGDWLDIEVKSDSSVIALGDTVTVIAVPRPDLPDDQIYIWEINGNIIEATGDSIRFFVYEKIYSILVKTLSAEGCEIAAFTQFEAVEPIIEMPNAFTPNRDMLNDNFQITYKLGGPLEVREFIIVNRWGEVVYNNPGKPEWDGTVNNKQGIGDTYVYQFQVVWPNGDIRKYVGEVTLVR